MRLRGPIRGRGLRVLTAALAATCVAGAARAATILNDGFETTTHPTGFRTVATGTGAAFYTRNDATTTGTAAITTDAAVGGAAPQVLTVTNNQTTSQSYPVLAPLGGFTTLTNTNDTATLSFKFRFINATSATTSNGNFRFGLFTSQGTVVTGDNQPTTSDDDQGYYVQFGNSAQTTNNLFYRESGGTQPILGGVDRANIAASTTVAAITDTASHTASLTLTRTSATAIGLSLSIDGGAAVTGSTSSSLISSFDEIGFTDGFVAAPLNFAIDDVQLTASNFTVPEPGAIGLAAVAGMAGLMRRRQRRA